MPFSNIGAYACQKLQTNLVDYYGKNSPAYRTNGSTSLIKWLLSPQNTASFQKINVTSIPGKKRGVAFRTDEAYCFDIARKARACNVTPANISQTPQEIVFDLDIDPYRPISGGGDDPSVLKIDLEALRQYCTVDDMSWITNQINRFLLRFEEQLDKRFFELLAPLIGTNFAGDAITNLPLWTVNSLSNTAALNPEAEFAIGQTLLDIGVNQQYAMIGGALVNKIRNFMKWAAGDAAGVDMSKYQATNPYPFYDRNSDGVLGSTDFLLLAPGTVQLVTWNMFAQGASTRKEVTDLYTHGTITLPTTGLEIDYQWTYDYNCKVWTFEPILYADLAVVPSGGCDTPDANGTIRIHDCSGQEVIPVCAEQPAD